MYSKKNADRDGSRKPKGREEKRSFKGNALNEEKRSFRKKDSTPEEGKDKPFRKSTGSFGKDNDRKDFRSKDAAPKRSFRSDDSRSERPFEKKRFEKSESSERPIREKSFRSDKDGSAPRPFTKRSEGFSENDPERTEKRSFSLGKRSDRPRVRRNNDGPKQEHRSQKTNDGRIRLNKVIAASGVCSRREADDMIIAGLVSVNGTVITELGSKVFPTDDVRYNGQRLRQERLVYIVMNKPKDFVTTTADPHAKKTVMDLIAGACKERVFPVGRLDRNTTGVLLITNDGELAKKLTHPSHNKKKIYHVHLDKNLKTSDIETISKGIELEDGFVKADEISFIDPEDKKQVGIEIHSGKNHIVRRIFEQLDYKVVKLDRVYFAGLTKKGLQRGHWRFLTGQEIGMLKMGSYQ